MLAGLPAVNKRVGLHYIHFCDSVPDRKSLPPIPSTKKSENAESVTNFG